MRKYKYGKTSKLNIESTSPRMQKLCKRALRIANRRKLHCPDFGISDGKRTTAQQIALFELGKSKCDGVENKSSHQFGMAIDYYAYGENGEHYNPGDLALVFSCFQEAALDMRIQIKWGGNFNSLADGCHIELVS